MCRAAWSMLFGLVLGLSLAAPVEVSAAVVYRCVAEDGSVSYTDDADACPGEETTNIESHRTDDARVAAQREALTERRQEQDVARTESRNQAADEESDERQRAQNCQTQRDWLRQLQNTPRLFTTDEATGERTVLNTAQREAKLKDARDRVAAACNR